MAGLLNRGRANPVAMALLVLALFLAGGAWLIHRYLALETQRDLREWQTRLSLIADIRSRRLESWLQRQQTTLAELADNLSLRLYLTRLEQAAPDRRAGMAEAGYLRNLLLARARRDGYLADDTPSVPANLPATDRPGLAILGPDAGLLVATPGFPRPGKRERAFVQRLLAHPRPLVEGLVFTPGGRVLLVLGVGLRPVEGMAGKGHAGAIGVILAVRDARRDLFPMLRAGNFLTRHDETLLVRAQGDELLYLTPLADDGEAGTRRLPLATVRLAAAHILRHPDAFGQWVNYAGRPVLASGRRIPGTPWTLVQTVDAHEALRDSRAYRRFLLTAFSLALALVTLALVAAWRHGSSVRAQRLAAELERQARALRDQARLLQAVTAHIPDYVLLLDAGNRVRFANRRWAEATGTPTEELVGKDLRALLGPAAAAPLEDRLQRPDGTEPLPLRIGQREGIYLVEVAPVTGGSDHEAGDRLLVLHDITRLHRAERKQTALRDQVIQALTRALDSYDPYSSHHSARVAAIATALGETLGLRERALRDLGMAAQLANIGKLYVPREILLKTEPLDEAEQAEVRRHVDHALAILEGVDFDPAVRQTIAQKQERMDGSGYPRGLRDGDILLPARILAVANSFVALVSPRAWRNALGIEDALDRLLADGGRHYDRQVVAALFHLAENRREWLEGVFGNPA